MGDWVIGTGSKALESATGKKLTDKLIYAMKVTDRVTFEDYWIDKRFQYKKPTMNGTLVGMFGDNFYHRDDKGIWVQEDSAHSNLDGTPNQEHLRIDTGGNNILISEQFYYFGDVTPTIPSHLNEICHTGIGEKKLQPELSEAFVDWLSENFRTGIHGDPLSWAQFNQLELF